MLGKKGILIKKETGKREVRLYCDLFCILFLFRIFITQSYQQISLEVETK